MTSQTASMDLPQPPSLPPGGNRSIWRWLAWGLAAAVLLPLLVLVAWVLSNLQDAPALPRPPGLAPVAAQLPAAANAAYALAGLGAAADRDAATVGRALLEAETAFATLPAAQKQDAARLAAYQKALQELTGSSLPQWSGAPLVCESNRSGCATTWLTQIEALSRQLERHAVFGRRCEDLLDGPFLFEEVPLAPVALAGPLAVHIANANRCATWFQATAALAWSQGKPDIALKQLQRADKLHRTVFAGSHSLLSQMVALSMSRRTLDTVAALAVRDTAFASRLAPMATPLPNSAAAVQRWMSFESNFGRLALAEAFNNCDNNARFEFGGDDGVLGRLQAQLESFLCRHHIGMQPQRTQQQYDAFWMQRMNALGVDLSAAIALQAQHREQRDAQPLWLRLPWRNTWGAVLVDIADPAYDGYLLRHADAELQQQAVALALSAQQAAVPAAERAKWAQQQNISAALRERLVWQDDGRVLQVKTWQATHAAGATAKGDDVTQIAWPR